MCQLLDDSQLDARPFIIQMSLFRNSVFSCIPGAEMHEYYFHIRIVDLNTGNSYLMWARVGNCGIVLWRVQCAVNGDTNCVGVYAPNDFAGSRVSVPNPRSLNLFD